MMWCRWVGRSPRGEKCLLSESMLPKTLVLETLLRLGSRSPAPETRLAFFFAFLMYVKKLRGPALCPGCFPFPLRYQKSSKWRPWDLNPGLTDESHVSYPSAMSGCVNVLPGTGVVVLSKNPLLRILL